MAKGNVRETVHETCYEASYRCKRKVMLRTTTPTARISVDADGYCLFRAMFYWLIGNESQHEIVRSPFVSDIRNDWKNYGKDINGEDVEQYLKRAGMDSHGVWGTEME